MAMTFTSPISTVTTGSTLSSANYNQIVTTLNNNTLPPMCQMVLTPNQVIGTGTNTNLTSSSFNYDTDSMSSTANQITINTAGIYLVSFSMFWPTNATNQRVATVIVSNTGSASGNNGYAYSYAPGSGTSGFTMANSCLVSLTAGQYLNLQVFQASGSSLTVNSTGLAYLQAAWVGI
jgi:hypothetical protein